ncbi:MAG: tetratricopeptide repeat protein, partial [Myxococcales bacterium]|nr:tetratricopeptide repeat protein [Myxococcales bacterium]
MRTPLLASFALAAALTGSAAPAGAQTTSGSEEFDVARGLYADGDFAAAVPHIVAAIQAEPENPRYYLGLARAYYQLHEHDLAVYYYDLYLNELRDLIPGDVRASDRVDRVRDERAGANGLRENSSTSPSGPAAALEARRALLDRIETGPIVGATGGGALSMYEAMLRTGYAHPDLVELRSRLADALLREANATVSDDATALPVL